MIRFILAVWFIMAAMMVTSPSQQAMADTSAPDFMPEVVSDIALHDWQSENLTLTSEFITDPGAKLTFRSAAEHQAWQAIDDKRLLFESMDNVVWLKSAWSTRSDGTVDMKQAILEFHRLIDVIDMQIYENNRLLMQVKRGAFLRSPTGFTGTNKNILRLYLKPDSEYRLYARLRSDSLISTSMTLWEEESYRLYDQKIMFLFIAYAAVVLTIAFYNVGAFVSTRYRVFGYHALYALAILLLQVSQYGYLDAYLSSDVFAWRQLLTTVALIAAYTAIMAFIMAVVEHRDTPVFYRWATSTYVVNGLLLIAFPFLGFETVMTLLVLNVASGVVLGTVHLTYLWVNGIRTKAVQLTILLLLFVPSGSMALMSRLGVFSQSLMSDYLTLLLIVVELVIVSIFLFAEMRGIRNRFLQAQFSDPRNHVPNILAMKKQMNYLWRKRKSFALTYVWFFGLERMEIAKGSDFVDYHIKMLAELTTGQLHSVGLAADVSARSKGLFTDKESPLVFYCEKNTLGVLSQLLTPVQQKQLHDLLLKAVHTLKQEQGYAMDLSPVVASSNMRFKGRTVAGIDAVIENTTLTLSQCIQQNESLMLYSDAVGMSERKRIALMNDFEQALVNDEFYLQWQPQIDAEGQYLAGLETLVRWYHPDFGEVLPSQFIPLLEQDTRITQLSLWVVRNVFQQAPSLLEQFPGIDISINLSVHDLMGNRLLPELDKLLQSVDDTLAQHVVFEVTESVHMEDNQTVSQAVLALQARGFRVSVDDFGAGYASFGYLQTLTLNEIKIDRRYTETCHERNSQAIIQSIIDMAKRLGLTIVVEGIENQQQQDYFTSLGVDRLQGWHLSKPRRLDDVLLTYASPAQQCA